MPINQSSLYLLIKTGITEIIREPKVLFFTLLFPFFFFGLFGVMNFIISPSQKLGISFLEYLFPGLLMFALVSIGFLGTSVPIIEMRQKGILKTFQITPLRKEIFIFSQIIVRLIFSILQIIIFALLGLLLGYVGLKTILPFIFISILGMVMILTLGFLFGGLFNNMEIASGILSFSMVPLLMLSGAMLPLYILPDVIQYVSYIIPFTYLSDLYHQTLYGLNGKVPPMINILLLFVLSALFFYFTKKSFRWK